MPEFQTNAAFRKDSTFHRANDHNLGSYSRLAVSYEHAFSQGGMCGVAAAGKKGFEIDIEDSEWYSRARNH